MFLYAYQLSSMYNYFYDTVMTGASCDTTIDDITLCCCNEFLKEVNFSYLIKDSEQ